MKYKDWLDMWLTLYVKPMVKLQTYKKYEGNVRVHIIPVLGGYELELLSAVILQNFVVSLTKSLAANSVNSVITVLHKSLKMAVSLGICATQYADKIVRPKPEEKKVECFTIAEQNKIERAVLESNKRHLMGIIICLYTGLRIGELLALQWCDLDLKKGIIYVSKSCRWGKINGGYNIIIDTPKTRRSVREIPIPKQILPYIKEIKCKNESDYVISNKGRAVPVRSYQRTFELLLKRFNISHRGFHALRHTFATRAIECGMDIKTLSEILGHKNAEITLNRYAHSLMEHKREMMNKLGRQFVSTKTE